MRHHTNRVLFYKAQIELDKKVIRYEALRKLSDEQQKCLDALKAEIKKRKEYYQKHRSKRGDNLRVKNKLSKEEFKETIDGLKERIKGCLENARITDEEWLEAECLRERLRDYKAFYKNY